MKATCLWKEQTTEQHGVLWLDGGGLGGRYIFVMQALFLTQRKEYSKSLSFKVLFMYYHLKSFYIEILYQTQGPYLQFLSAFYLSL